MQLGQVAIFSVFFELTRVSLYKAMSIFEAE